jgi:hypothetical protein
LASARRSGRPGREWKPCVVCAQRFLALNRNHKACSKCQRDYSAYQAREYGRRSRIRKLAGVKFICQFCGQLCPKRHPAQTKCAKAECKKAYMRKHNVRNAQKRAVLVHAMLRLLKQEDGHQ